MEKDNIASGKRGSLTAEPSFPADFAQRVLLTAQQKARRRRLRNRVAAAAAVLLMVSSIPIAVLIRAPRETLTSRDTADAAKRGWDVRSIDAALAYQLAQGTHPRSAGDYLLPNARALIVISSGYSEAPWLYDPQWSYSR